MRLFEGFVNNVVPQTVKKNFHRNSIDELNKSSILLVVYSVIQDICISITIVAIIVLVLNHKNSHTESD